MSTSKMKRSGAKSDRFSNTKKQNMANYVDIYKACRLCGLGNGYKMPIVHNMGQEDDMEPEVELRIKIKDCLSILVDADDRMPPLICELCVEKVNDFYEFREMCWATNNRVRGCLGLPPQASATDQPADDCILGVAGPVFCKSEEPKPKLKPGRKTNRDKKEDKKEDKREDKREDKKVRVRSPSPLLTERISSRRRRGERSPSPVPVSKKTRRSEPIPAPTPIIKRSRRGERSPTPPPQLTKKARFSLPAVAPKLEKRVKPGPMSKRKEEKAPPVEVPKESPNTKKGSFVCGVCSQAYYKPNLLRSHQLATHSPVVWADKQGCSACREWFPTIREAEQHHKWHRTEGVCYTCERCSADFRALKGFTNHFELRQCIPQPVVPDFKCPECQDLFATETWMNRHKCRGPPPTKEMCSKCQKHFPNIQQLKRHEKSCKVVRQVELNPNNPHLKALKSISVPMPRCDNLLTRIKQEPMDTEDARVLYNVAGLSIVKTEPGTNSEMDPFSSDINVKQEIKEEPTDYGSDYGNDGFGDGYSSEDSSTEATPSAPKMLMNPFARKNKNRVESLSVISLRTIFCDKTFIPKRRKSKKKKQVKQEMIEGQAADAFDSLKEPDPLEASAEKVPETSNENNEGDQMFDDLLNTGASTSGLNETQNDREEETNQELESKNDDANAGEESKGDDGSKEEGSMEKDENMGEEIMDKDANMGGEEKDNDAIMGEEKDNDAIIGEESKDKDANMGEGSKDNDAIMGEESKDNDPNMGEESKDNDAIIGEESKDNDANMGEEINDVLTDLAKEVSDDIDGKINEFAHKSGDDLMGEKVSEENVDTAGDGLAESVKEIAGDVQTEKIVAVESNSGNEVNSIEEVTNSLEEVTDETLKGDGRLPNESNGDVTQEILVTNTESSVVEDSSNIIDNVLDGIDGINGEQSKSDQVEDVAMIEDACDVKSLASLDVQNADEGSNKEFILSVELSSNSETGTKEDLESGEALTSSAEIEATGGTESIPENVEMGGYNDSIEISKDVDLEAAAVLNSLEESIKPVISNDVDGLNTDEDMLLQTVEDKMIPSASISAMAAIDDDLDFDIDSVFQGDIQGLKKHPVMHHTISTQEKPAPENNADLNCTKNEVKEDTVKVGEEIGETRMEGDILDLISDSGDDCNIVDSPGKAKLLEDQLLEDDEDLGTENNDTEKSVNPQIDNNDLVAMEKSLSSEFENNDLPAIEKGISSEIESNDFTPVDKNDLVSGTNSEFENDPVETGSNMNSNDLNDGVTSAQGRVKSKGEIKELNCSNLELDTVSDDDFTLDS